MKKLLAVLQRHWFEPASLRDLARVRIVVVAFQLFCLLAPDAAQVLGMGSTLALKTQRWFTEFPDESFGAITALKLLLLPFGEWGERPPLMFLQAIWWLGVISGVFALVGYGTRFSMLCFAVALTLLGAHSYSYAERHHTQALPTLAMWALALGPIGGAYSLDALRARIRRSYHQMRFEPQAGTLPMSELARWPLRVIQWLFVLAYLSAGYFKLVNGGLDWYNGYAITRPLVLQALSRDTSFELWLVSLPFAMPLLAIFTAVFELTFVLAILVPSLALFYVAGGALLHLGIYLLQGADFMRWPLLYIAFTDELRRGWRWWRKPRPRSCTPARWQIVYDGLCPLCIRSMVILDACDWRRCLSYVDFEADRDRLHSLAIPYGAARHAMHVVDPAGRVHRGFFGFRVLARALPPLWPLLPLLYAPFATVLGPRIYDRVASQRARQPCRAESCQLEG